MASEIEQEQEQDRVREQGNELERQMLRQAEGAVAGENDTSAATSAERRHIGRDIPLEQDQNVDTTQTAHNLPPPAYGETYDTLSQAQDGLGTHAKVADDGRVNIRINQYNRRLSELLVPNLTRLEQAAEQQHAPPPAYIPPSLGGDEAQAPPPPLNVVVQVVGSRGDVQPFVALGKVLKERYGHRVRFATHPNFRDFITENELEFFNIGGDPQALMAFMVKNPGLMPGLDSLRTGDVGQRRKEVSEYLQGCWRSCFETGDGSGPPATDETIEDWLAHHPQEDNYLHSPFVADCIIANPPSFAHIHCAEKLGIPVHIMFTMPYSPTQAFPHPLANIQSSDVDDRLSNYISYALIDMLQWQGLGDVINRFRERSLGLDEISLIWAPGMMQRLRVPHTYCWSPALIPKPKDWGPSITLSGFYFLDLATNYTPDSDLQRFLDAGPPPVYIGFGSIVLDDPNAMTKLIFEAVTKSGQRALVSKGWGGVGADELDKPDSVFMLGNIPHDWLFQRVSCVVHHGGAGTTAAGIRAGRPTVVVPFFGDQPFWGAMVSKAGAGPPPIHNKHLTADNLAEAIRKCLEPQSQHHARELASKMASENGSEKGAQYFHQFLRVDDMRCNLAPSRPAVWRIKRTQARLSAMAACTLAEEGLLDFHDLKLFRSREYETDEGPWEPITGGATALIGTMSTMMLGVADFPIDTLKALKIHPDAARKKSKADSKAPEGLANIPVESSSASASASLSNSIETRQSSSPSRPSSTRSGTQNSLTSDVVSGTSTCTVSTFNLEDSLANLNPGPLSPGLQARTRKHRSSSMAEALSGQLDPTSRSRSGSRPRSPASPPGSNSNNMFQTAAGTSKGLHRIVEAGFKSPMDFSMGIAKGFHNAPKLYGDESVRPAERVTDFKSGLKAASREFGFGMYDGITGLVTQPVKGAAKEGGVGFLKGIGKGIGGLALKPGAAIFGLPGYAMKGVYKEIQKNFGSSVQRYIIAARTAQGFEEFQAASEAERRDVILRWNILQKDLKKKRNPDELVRDIWREQRDKMGSRRGSQRNTQEENRGSDGNDLSGNTSPISSALNSTSTPIERSYDPENAVLAMGIDREHERNRNQSHGLSSGTAEEQAVAEAVRQSVLQTSSGDPQEDARVEQGMWADMAEHRRTRTSHPNERENEQLRRAMEESAAEAARHQIEQQNYDNELERALAQSLRDQRGWDLDGDSDVPESPTFSTATLSDDPPQYDAGHVAGTSKAEFKQSQDVRPGEKTQQEMTEEQIVLEYIKKQSLLEEENRKKVGASNSATDDNDEELQRAMKLSMQGYQQPGEASGS